MSNFFKVKEHGSTVRTEIMAGVTTFMAMAYILMVNAGMFANPFGDGTTCWASATAQSMSQPPFPPWSAPLLIGLLSNLPLAQASGMGLNAYLRLHRLLHLWPELRERAGARSG